MEIPFVIYQKLFMLLFSVLNIRFNTLPSNKVSYLFNYMLWTDVTSGIAMPLYVIAYDAKFPDGIHLALLLLSETAENTQIVLGLNLMLLLVLILYGRNASNFNVTFALVWSIAISVFFVFGELCAEKGKFRTVQIFAVSLMMLLTILKMILSIAAGYELLRLKQIKHENDSRSNFQVVYRQKYLANELFLFMIYVFLVFDFLVFLPHVLDEIPAFDEWDRKSGMWKITKFFYTVRPLVYYVLLCFYARIKSQRQDFTPRRRHQSSVLHEASEETVDTLQHNDSFNQFAYSSTVANVQANSTLYPGYRSREHIRSSRFSTLFRALAAEPNNNSGEQTPLLGQENAVDTRHSEELSVRLDVTQENRPYTELDRDYADIMQGFGLTSSLQAIQNGDSSHNDSSTFENTSGPSTPFLTGNSNENNRRDSRSSG